MSQPATVVHAGYREWFAMRNLWLVILPWGLFLRLCLSTVQPNDFWWHVRTGQIILQTRTIPTVDLFTYTQSGAPWINQAWLMQVVLALLMQWGGVPLIIFVHAFLITAGYTIILFACAPRYGIRTSVWATVVGASLGLQSWAVRPQAISFLAFGLLIVLIEAHRHGHRRSLWWAAPLFVLWVNAHGVFVFGLAALGIYVIGTLWDVLWAKEWQMRRNEMIELCAQGLLALAVLAINPQGPLGIGVYILGFFQSNTTLQYNFEFAPLMIRSTDGLAFAFALPLLIVARLNSTTRLTTAQTLTILVFAAIALFSRRGAPWFGMALIPILASLLHGWWRMPLALTPDNPVVTAALFALLLLCTVAALPWWRPQIPQLIATRPLLDKTTPVEATKVLCEKFTPDTRGFQSITFASYMEAACPHLPTFLDTRFELFSTQQWEEYIDMHNGRYNWSEIADHYEMEYLMVQLEDQPHLVDAASADRAWEEIYRDDRAVIFQRRQP